MCFIVDENNPEQKIATEDIECYKTGYIGLHGFTSKWYGYKYLWNTKEFEKSLKVLEEDNCSYEDTIEEDLECKKCKKVIYNGYHSFSTITRAIFDIVYSDYCIIKCIIPKGSVYYYNQRYEEYVSSCIIPKKSFLLNLLIRLKYKIR